MVVDEEGNECVAPSECPGEPVVNDELNFEHFSSSRALH